MIEIVVDTNERKSLPVLQSSKLFSIAISQLAVGDVLIKTTERTYCVEIKIGNDICDLQRAKEEITNMMAFESERVETHLVFIEEGYTPAEIEHPWVINSECHRAGVYFHRRRKLEHLPVLIKKIASAEYRKQRLYIKQPPKLVADGKTHRALPFVARVLALIDGVTVETALDLYDEIKKRSDKEPGVHDMFRELVVNTISEFPTWVDEKIGGWKEKEEKIDTDRKKQNFLKLSAAEKIEKYRAAIVQKIIHTLTAEPEEEKEEKSNE